MLGVLNITSLLTLPALVKLLVYLSIPCLPADVFVAPNCVSPIFVTIFSNFMIQNTLDKKSRYIVPYHG